MSHGDLRPGNLLFAPSKGRDPAPQVIFADWEAMAITPVMWDFLYCTTIGQSVALRRQLRDKCVAFLRGWEVC